MIHASSDFFPSKTFKNLIICRKFFSFYYFLIFQHFCMFWLHINVLCTFTQTFKVWVEVFYYIYFSQETCEVKKKCEIFFHTWALRPKGFRTSNLIKRGIQNLVLLQKVSNEQKISSSTSGFREYIMTLRLKLKFRYYEKS